MLALIGRGCAQRSPVARHFRGLVAVMDGLKLETQHQHVQKCAPNLHTSTSQPGNLLKSLLGKKRKRRWFEAPPPVPTGKPGFLTPVKKKKDQQDSPRMRILNVVVYKAVSDLLFSHEVNADLHKYSVEITKVSFTADFCSCRIYWKTSWSADEDHKIQELLDKSARRIRFLLMSLQILNNVPPLTFVRDKKYAALKEVENLLEVADYGPSEDVGDLDLGGRDAETRLQSTEPLETKRTLWFNIDHDALYKQIEDYKQQANDSASEGTCSPALTQKQLDSLAEIRKQKLIEKKKRKSKKLVDDDITPKAFLLAKQLQKEEQEGEQFDEHSFEDSQDSELKDDRK